MATMFYVKLDGVRGSHDLGELTCAERLAKRQQADRTPCARLYEVVPTTPAEWEAWGTEVGSQGQRSRRVYDLGWWHGAKEPEPVAPITDADFEQALIWHLASVARRYLSKEVDAGSVIRALDFTFATEPGFVPSAVGTELRVAAYLAVTQGDEAARTRLEAALAAAA